MFFLLGLFWWVDLSSTNRWMFPAEDPYFRHLSSFESQKGQLWQRLGLATSRDGGLFSTKKTNRLWRILISGLQFERMTLTKQLRSLGGKGPVSKCDHIRPHLLQVFFLGGCLGPLVFFLEQTCCDLGFWWENPGSSEPWSSSICLGRESIILG